MYFSKVPLVISHEIVYNYECMKAYRKDISQVFLFVCLNSFLDGIRGKIVIETWEKGTNMNRNKYNACLTVRNNKTQTD